MLLQQLRVLAGTLPLAGARRHLCESTRRPKKFSIPAAQDAALAAYHVRYGRGVPIPRTYVHTASVGKVALGNVAHDLRLRRKRGTLDAADIQRLDERDGFVWDVPEWRWQVMYSALQV